MNCWNCGTDLNDPSWGKISFREVCDRCGSSLHCCKNCVYYKPGLPNDCLIPGTDTISDRTAMNFCEDFKLLGKGPVSFKNSNEAAKRLFGDFIDDAPRDPKKRFNALFDDDVDQR